MEKKYLLSFKNHKYSYSKPVVLGLIVLAVLFASACNSSMQTVNLVGEEPNLALLVGEWVGGYYSAVTGRSGTIIFKLAEGEDIAHGEVIMTPQGSKRPYQPIVAPPHSEWLEISFVWISEGRVKGELTPYWDPDSKSTLLTIFKGKLKGDIIEGTFTSRLEKSKDYYTGTWKVSRKKNRR